MVHASIRVAGASIWPVAQSAERPEAATLTGDANQPHLLFALAAAPEEEERTNAAV